MLGRPDDSIGSADLLIVRSSSTVTLRHLACGLLFAPGFAVQRHVTARGG
jgi:hypothetical protein